MNGMCGRYAAALDSDELLAEFEIELDRTDEPTRSLLANPQQPHPGSPDFNMAPSKLAPVVLTRRPRASEVSTTEPSRSDADDPAPMRQLRLLSWGLVPSWAKDPKVGSRLINARAESVLEKSAYAKAAISRRCIVPASGWYEWQPSPTALDAKGKPRKQPFFMQRADGASIGFAGLYEFWRDRAITDSGDPTAWLTSFTIITTTAEPGLDRIHDRQPHALEPDQWSDWLDPSLTDTGEVAAMLAGHEPGRFTAYPVSRAVGNNRANGPELTQPIAASELVGVVDPETGEIIGGSQ